MHNTLESAARGAQSRRMFPLTLRRQGTALAAGAAAGAGAVLYGVLAPFGPGLALGAAMKKAKDAPFPFGPALSLAGWLTALCGGPAVSWYLSLF